MRASSREVAIDALADASENLEKAMHDRIMGWPNRIKTLGALSDTELNLEAIEFKGDLLRLAYRWAKIEAAIEELQEEEHESCVCR